MLKRLFEKVQNMFEANENDIEIIDNAFEMDEQYALEASNNFFSMQNSLAV